MPPRPGRFPKRLPLKTEGTIVYKAYSAPGYSGRGTPARLLYVGITDNLYARMAQHASSSKWWHSAERLEIEHYETRSQAQAREKELVRLHAPPDNKALQRPDIVAARKNRPKARDCKTRGCGYVAVPDFEKCAFCLGTAY